MPNLYNAGQLASIIIKLGEKDIDDLGSDVDSQQSYIFYYMNLAMMELAKLADVSVESDAMALSSDGIVTFTRSGSAITDMFEPKRIMYTQGSTIKTLQKRTADEAPIGWWRESQNSDIHIRGFAATSQPLPATTYTLKYLKYPKQVTIATDEVEFSPSGYMTLIHRVLSLIKYAKNSYQGIEIMDQKAKAGYNNLVQGAISARGTGTSGQPLGIADATQAKG
jgi:hypothetical protein